MTVNENNLELSAVVAEAIERHGATRDALIPILSEVNKAIGYIPKEAFREIRRQIKGAENELVVHESQLFSLASFYHMLSTQPVGRHVIRFCESAPCHVVGGRQILQTLKEELKLLPGETSPDNKWTFITTSCLGLCAVGPVVMVDEDIYGNITPEQIPGILGKYE